MVFAKKIEHMGHTRVLRLITSPIRLLSRVAHYNHLARLLHHYAENVVIIACEVLALIYKDGIVYAAKFYW